MKVKSQKSKVKSIFYLLLAISHLSLVILLGGCARTVTTLPVVGSEISLEIEFRGDIDTTNNRYYLVFSGSSPTIPYKGVYFFAPGENYDLNRMNISTDLNYYYTNYFSTWSDLILLKENLFTYINGPFVSTSHTSYQPVFLAAGSSAASDKIQLVLSLSKLSSIPATLYFNVICVGTDGNVSDYLRATDNKILTVVGTSIYGKVEDQDSTIDASLDISGWSMTVQ